MHYLNMALIDKASLLFVPSVVAQEKAFNILPSGNRAPDSTDQNSGYDQTRADFTFDRGTDHGATRIGSDGLIKKYRENVLTQSNNFSDSDWINVNSSETSGQEGYDGTSNAWLLTKTSANGRMYQSVSASGVQTFSVYAKSNTSNWVALWTSVGTSYFNLANGTKGSTTASTTIGSAIESVGNGWYRCSLIFNTSILNVRIYPADGDLDTSGTSGSIYIQNAQLESGMVSTDYLDSTSVTAKAGVLIDLPRINYDANGENGSLLLEPSRANLVQFSEYFDAWSKVNGGTGSNPVLDFGYTSPEGKDNAYKVTFDKGVGTTASDLSILQTSFTSGSNTASFYVKADAATRLMFRNSGTWAIYDIGTEWTRIEKTDTGGSLQIGLREGYGLSDVPDSCSVYLYGAQVESSATYATSYIPNHGESGGVTRAADSCNGGGSAESINSTEGVLYAEFAKTSVDSEEGGVYLTKDSSNEIRLSLATNNRINLYVAVGGVNVVYMDNTNHTLTDYNKIAVKYKENDYRVFINGTKVHTDTNASVPQGMNEIKFKTFVGNTKQVAVFNEALSDSELETLTTL
jgi:hypothetical protein